MTRTRPVPRNKLDMLLIQMTFTGACLATVEVSVVLEYGYEVSAEVVGERVADTGTICAARTSPMPSGMDLLRAAAASERVS
jgi:hypothetical protein